MNKVYKIVSIVNVCWPGRPPSARAVLPRGANEGQPGAGIRDGLDLRIHMRAAVKEHYVLQVFAVSLERRQPWFTPCPYERDVVGAAWLGRQNRSHGGGSHRQRHPRCATRTSGSHHG